ncbi:MAG: Spy/CpxP family protein refolding chaperone [Cellvibrionaceae bacterium]|jgi:Spy/CpxP family protein refolding chaperone
MKLLTRKKRYLIPVALTAAVLSSVALAHGKSGGEYASRLADKLSLTETQRVEFVKVIKTQHEKRQVIKGELRELKKAKFQTLREETRAELETVLSAEQLALLGERMEKRMKKYKGEGEKHRSHEHHH